MINEPVNWELVARGRETEVLERARSGGVSVVPALYALLVSGRAEVRAEALELLASKVYALSPASFVRLDRMFRERTSLNWSYSWKSRSPSALVKRGMTESDKIIVIGLSTFHPNGYFREKALRELTKHRDANELVFLLIRACDWVEPIRRRSLQAVADRVESRNVAQLFANISLFYRLSKLRIPGSQAIVEKLEQLLLSAPIFEELRRYCIRGDYNSRLCCYTLLLKSTRLSVETLSEQIRVEKIPRLRYLLLSRRLDMQNSDCEFLEGTLALVKDSKSKLLLLNRISLRHPARAAAVLEQHSFSTNAIVRRYSRETLSTLGSYDFRQMYAANVVSQKNLAGSIAGLREVGTPDDLPVIMVLKDNPSVRVVREVLRSMASMAFETHRSTIIGYLADERIGISSESRKLLFGRLVEPDSHQLMTVFGATNLRHVKANVMAALASFPKWDSIYYMLLFSDYNDVQIREFCLGRVTVWLAQYNRSFVTPSRASLDRIKEVLASKEQILSQALGREISFLLRVVQAT